MMNKNINHSKNMRGDTIIEVLFGVTIFALISVTSMGLMNRATAMSQRSLEMVQVRQEIDSQVDIIRLAHASYISEKASGKADDGLSTAAKAWRDIKQKARENTGLNLPDELTPAGVCNISDERGRMNPFRAAAAGSTSEDEVFKRVGSIRLADLAAKVESVASGGPVSKGISLAARPGSSGNGIYEVYVYACWDGPDGNIATQRTVVRLYDKF